jgi:uncharacterized protein
MKPEKDATESKNCDEEEFESAIYQGFVRHRRFSPKPHEFRQSLFMMLIKLDELPLLTTRFWQLSDKKLSWARFKRMDYIGGQLTANQDNSLSISDAVKQKIRELQPDASTEQGEVFLLGQLRYFGLYFSPLNLYYLRINGHFRYMLAEVSNTPWNERHYYLVDLNNIQPHDKAFHVSPFSPIDQRYHWKIQPPQIGISKTLLHLESHQQNIAAATDEKVFDATMVLKRKPLNQRQLSRVLLSTPIQTVSIVLGIYWQALKLFFKRVPVYGHPGTQDKNNNSSQIRTSHE